MKNAILSGNALTRLMKPAVMTLLSLTLLNAAPALANGGDPKTAPAEVKYLGSVNGNPTFQLVVNNTQGEPVFLTLRDAEGNLIYTDTIKDKTYARNIKFDGLDAEKLKLVLTLRTKKDVQTQSFEITRNIRTTDDIAVVSL
jgi:hypothetical protein